MIHRIVLALLLLQAVWRISIADQPQQELMLGVPSAPNASPATASVSKAAMPLDEFEAMAVSRHPSISSARARVEAARGRLIQARQYPNTVIGYSAGEMGVLDTAGKQGGFIRQQVITGGKRQLDQAIAAREIERAEADLRAECQRVRNDVGVRFQDVLIAQREVEVTAELRRVARESAKASEKLIAGRQISRPDLLQAQIEADEATILHDNAQNDHRQAWQQLCLVSVGGLLDPAPVRGDLDRPPPDYDWRDCLAMVLSGHPQLAAASAEVQRTRLAIDRAHRQRVPDLDFSVTMRHDYPTNDETVNLEAGLPIPFLDRNQGNIYRAEAEHTAARAELNRLRLDIENRLAAAFRRYANARHQVERYRRQILPKAEESLQLVRAGFDAGQVDYLTLLTSQRTYFRANLAYLQSLRELRQSVVLLNGKLLVGSLDSL